MLLAEAEMKARQIGGWAVFDWEAKRAAHHDRGGDHGAGGSISWRITR